MNHLLSNMVSAIQTALIGKKLEVCIQNSNLVVNCLRLLYRFGYIRGFVIKNNKTVVIFLKYWNNCSVIQTIIPISTPGNRIYSTNRQLRVFLRKKNNGVCIISTSRGLMGDEEACLLGLGGEVLLRVN